MHIEVRLFDEVVETFDLERPAEVVRLVKYMNFHSRNRRYRLRRVLVAARDNDKSEFDFNHNRPCSDASHSGDSL